MLKNCIICILGHPLQLCHSSFSIPLSQRANKTKLSLKGPRHEVDSGCALVIAFLLLISFLSIIYVVFVVVVVVASVGHPVAASQRCSVAVLEIQLYCPVCPPSSLLLSSPRNHHHHHYIKQSDACLEKKGLIKKDRREISTTFAPSRSIDLFDVDVTCVFYPRYYYSTNAPFF